DAGDGGDGCRPGRETVLLLRRTRRLPRAPDNLARFQVERVEAGTYGGRGVLAGGREVGDGYVHVLAIRRGTPLASAQRASLARARLPQDGAFLIGVECVHHSRLLTDDQRAPSAAEAH